MLLRSKKIKLSTDNEDSSSWSMLPAKNLQDIFKHLHIYDVEKCLQVCRSWYNEANYYLKDKFWFSIAKVKSFEDFKKNLRRFQFLLIIQDKGKGRLKMLEKILRCIRQRRVSDQILDIRIEFHDYPSLSKILQQLQEKHVKTLTLLNAGRKWCKLNSRTRYLNGLKLEFRGLDYGCLLSVETLWVIYWDNSLLNISQSFGSLKSLKFSNAEPHRRFSHGEERISIDLLRDFIDLNPLTTLDLEEAKFVLALATDTVTIRVRDFNVESLLSFENVKNLRTLRLRTVENVEEIEVLLQHFEHLEVIKIMDVFEPVFIPCHVDQLLSAGFQGSIGLYSFEYFNDDVWRHSWTNIKNLNITHLDFSCELSEECLKVFIKSFPNIKSFICEYVNKSTDGFSSTSLFTEISNNWTRLESLAICFLSDFFSPSSNEIVDFRNLSSFELKHPSGSYVGFQRFSAVNLKNFIFDAVFFHDFNEQDEQLFKLLGEKCPNIERVEIRGAIRNEIISCTLRSFTCLTELHLHFNYEIKVSNSEEILKIINVLEILSERNGILKKIVIESFLYLKNPYFDEFFKSSGAIAEYKNGILKRILISDLEIFFVKVLFIYE